MYLPKMDVSGFTQTWKVHLLEFLELFWKVLKIKYALKSTGKSLDCLEKSLSSTIFCRTCTVDRDLNQYNITVPLFVAAYAHNDFILIF